MNRSPGWFLTGLGPVPSPVPSSLPHSATLLLCWTTEVPIQDWLSHHRQGDAQTLELREATAFHRHATGRKILPVPVKPRQQSCWRPLWSWYTLTMVNVPQELKGKHDYLFFNGFTSLVNLRSISITCIWWPMSASSNRENHKQLKCAKMTCKRTEVHLYDGFCLVYGLVEETYFSICRRSKTYCQGQSQRQKLKGENHAAVLYSYC